MRPLISHEIPHSLAESELKGEHAVNDYMFILLHRYIEDERYRKIVNSYKGFTILDNSCFELGEALSNELIYEYVNIINPDVFVLPDTLGDMQLTLDRSYDFLDKYPDFESKAMAVIQGDSFKEFAKCYTEFDRTYSDLSMIGIPFCFNWAFALKMDPFEHSMERVKLLHHLDSHSIINPQMKHHLLGTWNALEFKAYKHYNWIYSIDTSNPIAAGIEGDVYPILHKPKIKFDEFVEKELHEINIDAVMNNTRIFKEWTSDE